MCLYHEGRLVVVGREPVLRVLLVALVRGRPAVLLVLVGLRHGCDGLALKLGWSACYGKLERAGTRVLEFLLLR
jgi:hypothetical protein